ncbi:MAG: hypothetical protein HYT34_00290, partial [Candidatus Ryanbacteria bacterium]|nr:hypothetical protein [Candidatus Ryanbacteria bacterium]
ETGTFVNDVFGLDFAPDADRIAWMTPINETSLSLRTSNPDETSIKTVATVQIPDFEIYWIKKDLLALKSKTSSEAPSLLQTMSLAGVSNIISSEKKGFDVIWHGDGTEYLSSEDGVKLEVHDEKNSTVKELSLKTLPEKCAFSIKDRNVLFCAVPRSLGQETLPDAWWQGRVNFADSLWKINLGSGESSLLLGGGGFDITHLFTSPHEDYIFFINKNDSTLWSLRII